MKNIILQHWEGELSPLCIASTKNISNYASFLNVEYRLLRGKKFHKDLPLPCQKLHMLNEEFDEYDTIVMVDTDMFLRKGVTENVFEISGLGMHTHFQTHLFKSFGKKFPKYYDGKYPFWGGAIYKIDRSTRQELRKVINEREMLLLGNTPFLDEAIMHRLATLAKYNTNPYLPGEFKWCHCSYREGIEKAAMIHVRTKIKNDPKSPKRTKWENYQELLKRDLI
jgi:hypothetical protein